MSNCPKITRFILAALVATAVGAASPSSTKSVVQETAATPSGGTFIDAAGAKHSWSISAASSLIWDGKPYMPVGGAFYPVSLKSEASADWDKDVAALGTLKSHGVRDLIVVPEGSLVDVPAARLKRLLDYLDQGDFTYGLAFGIGVPDPLTGTVVKPASYKGYPDQSLTASWRIQNSDSALIALVDQGIGRNDVSRVAETKITEGNLTYPIETPAAGGKVTPYLYPHKSVPSGTRGSIPDLWSGYDTYRDRLLTLMQTVKPGKGFRFFLDPLGSQLSLSDETDYLVPDSANFLLEWESYIRTTYPNLDDVYQQWALEEYKNLSAHDLARLIPLWSNDVLTGYLYDPVKKKTIRLTDINQCHWWNDFLTCRNHSIRYYMNGFADVLKKQVADVPVVYTWTMNHQIFINPTDHDGFDGIGISGNQRGARLINRVAVPAYSNVLQSSRRLWFLETSAISEKDLLPAGQQPQAASNPYTAQSLLSDEVSELRKIGVKAFFPGSFTADASGSHAAWNSAPNTLDWLKDTAAGIAADSRSSDLRPQVLKFPAGTPGPATAGPIGSTGVYWVPGFDQGSFEDWWPTFTGYKSHLSSSKTQDIVLVSLQGKRKDPCTFMVVDPKQVTARTAAGIPVPVKITGKNSFQVPFVDHNPVILSTNDQPITSVDAATDALEQLDWMFDYAKGLKAHDIDAGRTAIFEAHTEFQKKNYSLANSSARSGLDRFVAETTPYLWIEGEMFQQNQSTFDDTPSLPGASNDKYLRISNFNNPPREYGVHYNVSVAAGGKYNIWMAATPPGAETSPFQWTLADNQRRDPADPNPRSYYANDRFGWILLGTATFKEREQNTLAIYVTGRAAATGRYSFGIDALFLTTSSNPPFGRHMPMPIDPTTIPRAGRKK